MSNALRHVGPSAKALDAAHRFLEDCVDRSQIAGAVALVAHGDEVIQLDCVGHRDIEAALPMQPDTIFRIASMTKPIVSVGALMLVEAGALRLDDPVSRFIPAFADSLVFDGVDGSSVHLVGLERPISIRDLLTHTSGLAGVSPHPMLDGTYADLETYDCPLAEMMQRLAVHPLTHQPGEGWVYGWSHSVLGHVIQVVADRPLDDYLATAVFEPLGMVDTGFHVPADKLERLAVAYEQGDGGLRQSADPSAQQATSPPVFLSGGGGCVSTVIDYRRFMRILEHGGGVDGMRLLAPETVAEMTRNQLDGSLVPIKIADQVFDGEGYGLGVGVIVGPGATLPVGSVGSYTWSGAWGTTFCIDPVAELSCVFLTQYEPWAWFREGAEYWSIVRGSLPH